MSTNETMPALVNYSSEPGSVELRDVAVPDIEPSEVLLAVEAVGICGSDLHQWQASHSWPVNYPCILGHEFGGTIARAGNEVDEFEEGDRVVSETAAVIDPHSPYSRQGKYHLDPNRLGFGYGVDGAMAPFVAVPERCLHAIPADLSFEKAALTEPCCVAYNAVCENATVQPGDHVLVLGPGPIGLLCAQMAALSGAGHLIVSGLSTDTRRLNRARQLGADTTLDDPDEVLPFIDDLGDGLGVDVVIDAAGVSDTLEQAMKAVRPAGHITKVGWGPQPMDYSLDPVVQKNVTIQGSFSHNWPIWERVLRMLSSGQIDLDPLIDRMAPLDEWHECFTKMHDKAYVKVVLTPGDISSPASEAREEPSAERPTEAAVH